MFEEIIRAVCTPLNFVAIGVIVMGIWVLVRKG